MPKKLITPDTEMWTAACETEIVAPVTQPAPGLAWSAEEGYGDTQDWPDEDEDELETELIRTELSLEEQWHRARQWRRTRYKAAFVLVCTGFMALVILEAGLARADTSVPSPTASHSYLATLDELGIPYPNDGAAVRMGLNVCEELRDGENIGDVVSDLVTGMRYTGFQAGATVGAAAATLCPDQHTKVTSWALIHP